MATTHSLLTLLNLLGLTALTFTAAAKYRHSEIISHLRNISDWGEVIPLPDNNDNPVTVYLGLTLEKIIDVDREKNEIELLVLQVMSYNNPALAWDISKEGFHAAVVTVREYYLWVPDITAYNAVSKPKVVSPRVAVVNTEGLVSFFPSVRVRAWCDLQDVNTNSGANCSLKFGPWTQSSKTVSLSIGDNGIATYLANPNYEVLATSATKHSKSYSCCPDTVYEDIEFSFIVRKQDQAVAVREEENGSEK